MNVSGPRAWVRRHPQAVDAVLALLLIATGVLGILLGHVRPSHGVRPDDVVPIVTAGAVVTGRRLRPGVLLGVTTVVTVGWLALTGEQHPILIVTGLVVAYTYATRVERRRVLVVAGACAAASFVAGGIYAAGGWWSPESVGTFAWTAAAVAVGDATRSRNAYVAEVEARALRAEQTREEEARRRVTEERLRIARELHDVIAHHIAVINVQAGAATHVLHSRPEAVGPALAAIRRAAEVAVTELAGMVGLLRNSDDLEPSVEPVHGLAGLPELLDALAASGLRVEHHRRGPERELPTLTDLAAFRIVQESLTNAQKYGTGQATLEIAFRPDDVRLVVSNPARPRREPAGSGYGIVGMRERAAAAGGTVSAGPDCGGRFVVEAVLPAPGPAPVPARPVSAEPAS